MKDRLAFVLGMALVGLFIAPLLPWSTWKNRIQTNVSPSVSSESLSPSSTKEAFEGDRSRPYLLRLIEDDNKNAASWSLFVEPKEDAAEDSLSGGRVTGQVFRGEKTYDVSGVLATSTDQLAYAAYDTAGAVVASATTTWSKQYLSTEIRWTQDQRARQARLEPVTNETVRLSFSNVAERWKDDRRSTGCEFSLTFPTVEEGGAVSSDAARAINRVLRDKFLAGKSTPEQVKNSYLRQCRTELEAEVEWQKAPQEVGSALQRSEMTSLQITRARAPWLSMMADTSMYTGGAHGSIGIQSFLFDVSTGRELGMSDLVRDEASLAALHGLIATALVDEYGEMLFEDQAATLRAYIADRSQQLDRVRAGQIGYSTNTTFLITPTGIRLFYQQYEIAPYAVGIPTVDLPFSTWSSLASDVARRVFSPS